MKHKLQKVIARISAIVYNFLLLNRISPCHFDWNKYEDKPWGYSLQDLKKYSSSLKRC